MDTDHDTDAKRRAAEQAWEAAPELRRYFQNDKTAYLAQALQAARTGPASTDQPALNAIHHGAEIRA